jgi:hypothetical protein
MSLNFQFNAGHGLDGEGGGNVGIDKRCAVPSAEALCPTIT